MFAAALLCKLLAECQSVTASVFCNSVFSVLVYTNNVLGQRSAGDFSLQKPEKFTGKRPAITKQGYHHRLLLWSVRLREQARGGLPPSRLLVGKHRKHGDFSQTWLVSVCVLSVNRTSCVKLEMHFPLASHSPKDALEGWRCMLNYHGNPFLFVPAEDWLHGQPRPGTCAVSSRSQPVFGDDCGG